MCSEEENFLKLTRELKVHLMKRGYDEQYLNLEIQRVLNNRNTSRDACLLPRQNQDKSARIPLVVTYHPILPTFQSITKRHLTILHASERLKEAFPLPPLIAFRRPRNLRDLLVRATLASTLHESPGNRPCGAIRCKTCPILLATDEFSSHATGEVFKVNTKASCKSSNIIYLTRVKMF